MDSMMKNLYDMELEELGRSSWQDEERNYCQVRKLTGERTRFLSQVEDKTGH